MRSVKFIPSGAGPTQSPAQLQRTIRYTTQGINSDTSVRPSRTVFPTVPQAIGGKYQREVGPAAGKASWTHHLIVLKCVSTEESVLLWVITTQTGVGACGNHP